MQKHHGNEAVIEIIRLHGSVFLLTCGAVGVYGERGEISLRAAATSNTSIAATMTSDMRQAIAAGDSAFTPAGELKQGGRTILQVSGLGKEHYYSQAGTYVIWLAADPQRAPEALKEILENYR